MPARVDPVDHPPDRVFALLCHRRADVQAQSLNPFLAKGLWRGAGEPAFKGE